MQNIAASFDNFARLFDGDGGDALFCLSSGMPAPPEVEKDLLSAEERGSAAFHDLVQQRFVLRSSSFHQPMRKMSLETFSSQQRKTRIHATSRSKTIEIKAERNIFTQLLLLSMENDVSLEKTLAYPMSPVPWALATADGLPTKTDKAKLMHALEKPTQSDDLTTEQCSSVIDGNAFLQSLVALPGCFSELAQKVFTMLPNSVRIDFVTDTYPDQSIKACERMHRGTSETFLVKGPSTKLPKDWKGFLSNGKNKTETMKLILSEWQKEIMLQS